MTIVIEKSRRRLTLWDRGEALLDAPIALGREPVGHKQAEGDGRTPEGVYRIASRNPQSKYHLSLGISYPGPGDARQALSQGRISAGDCARILAAHLAGRRPPWDTPLGGFVMIHGGGIQGDWTQGCVALRNEDMDRLWALCPLGTEVKILP